MGKLLMLVALVAALAEPGRVGAKCTSGDCRDGFGVFTFSDGDVYVGQFHNGQLSGRGKFGFAKGGYYEGEFKEGKLHGKGVLVNGGGKSVTGVFADNQLVPTPTVPPVARFWEMSDAAIAEMLAQAAREPNQTRFLDQTRIAAIRQGWQEAQISDKEQAIETAFDYLLRVNTYYSGQAARQRPRDERADLRMQQFFAQSRSQEEQQRLREIAEGEQRLAAMNRRPSRDIADKCRAKWPEDYQKQQNCMQRQTESKNWVDAHK